MPALLTPRLIRLACSRTLCSDRALRHPASQLDASDVGWLAALMRATGDYHIDLWMDVRFLGKFLFVLMHASGPLAHAAGCRVHAGYRAWQPFRGGPMYMTVTPAEV